MLVVACPACLGAAGVSRHVEGLFLPTLWVAEMPERVGKSPVEDYARTALMGMLTATGTVIDALIDGLGPVVVRLLQGSGSVWAGVRRRGRCLWARFEQELRTSGRELIRAGCRP